MKQEDGLGFNATAEEGRVVLLIQRLAHRCRDALSSARVQPANGFLAASGDDNELNSFFLPT